MGIFGNLFGDKANTKKQEEKGPPWIALTSVDQLADIDSRSTDRPQFIFKHSTTCGISRMVINMFKGSYDLTSEQADLYYLDLHAYRQVSNEVGYRFQVIHQSPQLLVIKNGATVAHASHGAIAEVDIHKFL